MADQDFEAPGIGAWAGSLLVLVGETKNELGGSVYYKTKGELGKKVPRVDKDLGAKVLQIDPG